MACRPVEKGKVIDDTPLERRSRGKDLGDEIGFGNVRSEGGRASGGYGRGGPTMTGVNVRPYQRKKKSTTTTTDDSREEELKKTM